MPISSLHCVFLFVLGYFVQDTQIVVHQKLLLPSVQTLWALAMYVTLRNVMGLEQEEDEKSMKSW